MSEHEKKERFGLNEAEYTDLMNGVRSGLFIVGAVIVTLLLVGVFSAIFSF